MGILRVEREIARRLLARSEFRAIPVVFNQGGLLLALARADVARIFAVQPPGGRQGLRLRTPGVRTPAPATPTAHPVRIPQQTTAGLRRAARASVARVPPAVREDVRAILIHSRQIVRTALYRRKGPNSEASAEATHASLQKDMLPVLRMVVHPHPSDVLWTAGLYSNFVPLRRIAELRMRTGLTVVATCYDLIRVMHPQFNPPSMGTELFAADAAALLDASDLVLAISEATRADLLAFAERARRVAPPVQVVRLGSDLPASTTPSELQIPVCPRDLPSRPFALAVGTVEGRKNYGLLVRIWERLAADPQFPLDLVIVGRLGFEADDSAAEIEGSPLFGSRIVWLERCPDQVLRQLYEQCHVVLCPSLAEGWGLPVAEALAFGRHVIASDRGALPEAGQGLARLLDPADEAGWCAAVAEAAAAPRLTVDPPDASTWDQAAASVAASLQRLMPMADAA